jgi:hypothetical protein
MRGHPLLHSVEGIRGVSPYETVRRRVVSDRTFECAISVPTGYSMLHAIK